MSSESSEADLEAQIAAIGRPGMVLAPLVAAVTCHATIAKWDAAHPQELARWSGLQSALDALRAENAKTAKAEEEAAGLRRVVGARIAEVLSNPKDTETLTAAREWAAGQFWSLVFLGNPGNGKSVAAAFLAKQWISRAGVDSVEWLRAQEVATLSAYGREAQDLKARARRVKLLVIDDYGDESESAPWKAWLGDVLGARYAAEARTVITSNLDAETFKARVGLRLTDRFREGAVIGITSPSMRKSPGGSR